MILATIVAVSFKTGIVLSMQSLTRGDQPKFEIDKSKIGKFLWAALSVFVMNIIYGLAIVQDINEIEGILILSLFNTAFITWGLMYLVLLKKKNEAKPKRT